MKTAVRLTDRKRAAIVDAAVSIFNEQGFDCASMDSIADQAQVSKRTVYNHFASKDRLFEEIVTRLKERAGTAIQFTYRLEKPLLGELTGFCRSVIDFHCSADARMLVRVVVSRFLKTPELAKEMFGNSKMFESLLRDWIRAAQRDGRLRDCDVAFASKQLLALLESFVVWPQLIKNAPTPSSSTRHKIAQSAVEMFLKYYE